MSSEDDLSQKTIDALLQRIREEVADAVGGETAPEAVRVDVDLFDGFAELVVGRRLDSLDFVHLIVAIEDACGVSLSELVDDGPLTLTTVAAAAAAGAARPS